MGTGQCDDTMCWQMCCWQAAGGDGASGARQHLGTLQPWARVFTPRGQMQPQAAPQEGWRTSSRATHQTLPLWPLWNVSGVASWSLQPRPALLPACSARGGAHPGGPCPLSTATSGESLGVCCVTLEPSLCQGPIPAAEQAASQSSGVPCVTVSRHGNYGVPPPAGLSCLACSHR